MTRIKTALWCPITQSPSGNGQRRRWVWVTLSPHGLASRSLTLYEPTDIQDCLTGESYPLERTLSLQGEASDWDALALSQSPEMQSAARGLEEDERMGREPKPKPKPKPRPKPVTPETELPFDLP